MNQKHLEILGEEDGFFAAADNSGGSSKGVLLTYGFAESEIKEDIFPQIHDMRARTMGSSVFDNRILGTILFKDSLDREIKGLPTAQYLWEQKGIVPIVKIDDGLVKEAEYGVKTMKPITGLLLLLKKSVEAGAGATKMRSYILEANLIGIRQVVDQQLELAETIFREGLIPMVEPEIDINSESKAEAEVILRNELLSGLDQLPDDMQVILKLTLPEIPNFYEELINHPRVLRVVALSGGYSAKEAMKRLSENEGMIASFSRALFEGLDVNMTQEAFDAKLDENIEGSYQASLT